MLECLKIMCVMRQRGGKVCSCAHRENVWRGVEI